MSPAQVNNNLNPVPKQLETANLPEDSKENTAKRSLANQIIQNPGPETILLITLINGYKYSNVYLLFPGSGILGLGLRLRSS